MASTAATDSQQISPVFTPWVFMLMDASSLSCYPLPPSPCPHQSLAPHCCQSRPLWLCECQMPTWTPVADPYHGACTWAIPSSCATASCSWPRHWPLLLCAYSWQDPAATGVCTLMTGALAAAHGPDFSPVSCQLFTFSARFACS